MADLPGGVRKVRLRPSRSRGTARMVFGAHQHRLGLFTDPSQTFNAAAAQRSENQLIGD